MPMKNVLVKRMINNKWLILLFNVLFFALMAWLLPIRFEVNDDAMMCMIANGKFTSVPNGHLVYINAIYGWVLAKLYGWIPILEWYTLLFCVLHVVSVTGIVCVVLRNKEIQRGMKAVFLIFVYVIWIRIIIDFQFTTTAGLLCFSGCLVLLQPNRKWWLWGACAVFVASLIRFHAAGMVGVICAPLFFVSFLRDKKLMLWVLVLVIFVLGGWWANGLFYSSPEWAKYKAYDAARSAIVDAPDNDLDESDLPEGISSEEYKLFCRSAADPNIMTLEKLLVIKTRIQENRKDRQAIPNLTQLKVYRIPIVLLCVGFLFLIVTCIIERRVLSNRYSYLFPLFGLVIIVLLLFYLGITAVLKNRAFLCILFPIIYQMVFYCSFLDGSQVRKLSCYVIAGVVMGITIKYAVQDFKVNQSDRKNYEMFLTDQKLLVDNTTDGQTRVVYPYEFYLDYISPFRIKDLSFRMGFGWFSNIPFDQNKMISSYLDFVDTDVLWFANIENSKVPVPVRVANSIEKNYGIKVEAEKVDYNEKYALYKFVSK